MQISDCFFALALVALVLPQRLYGRPLGPVHPVEPPPVELTPPAEPPDMIVFLMDDVGARTWELRRSALPNMDALADQGTEFVNGYGAPMCSPARISFFLSTWTNGNAGFACFPNEDGTGPGPTAETLPSGLSSLPKAAEAAGYNTALFGRWGLGTWPGSQAGTQDYAYTPQLWGFEHWGAGLPDGVEACGGGTYTNWLGVNDGQVAYETQYHTEALSEAFIAWWESTPSPRFALVCFQAAHKPFHWPPATAMPAGWTQPPQIGSRPKYEAAVISIDEALRRMLEVVDTDQLDLDVDLENTLVVVSSDNGDPKEVPPSPYGAAKVKFSTFDGGVRVPFIVAGCGWPVGQVSEQPVSLVDILPTLADLAGVCAAPPGADGQSILPALSGVALERDWIFVEGNVDDCAVVAIIDGVEWKLRHEPDLDEFLYNLDTDPFESSPLDPDAVGFEDVTALLRANMAIAQGN